MSSYSPSVVPTRGSQRSVTTGRAIVESQASLKVIGQRLSGEGCVFLYNLIKRIVIDVCTCVTLYCTHWGDLSRDSRNCRIAQIVVGRLQTHSSAFENMNTELQGREVSGPWPIPIVRSPLESETSLVNPEMQGLLGTAELAGDEMTSGPQVSECREGVRALLLRDSTDSGWELRHFCSTCWSGFRDVGRRIRRFLRVRTVRSCTSFGLLRGGIHRDYCRLRGTAGYYLRSSRGVCPTLFRRTAVTYIVVGPNCCMGREIQRSRRRLCAVCPRQRGRRTGKLKSSSGEGAGCEEGTFKRDRGPASEASANSKPRCSLMWRISLAGWSPSKSVGLLPSQRLAFQAWWCCEFLLPSWKTSSPALQEARTVLRAGAGVNRIRLLVKPARAVPPKGEVPPRPPLDQAKVLAKLAAVLDKPRSSRSGGGRIRSGSGRGNNGDGIHRCSQRRRIGRETVPATGRPCPGAIHSALPSRMPWDYYCGARDESAGRSDDSSRWILELATSRKGHPPPSSLWSFQKLCTETSWRSQELSTRAESEDSNCSTRCCARSMGCSNLQRRTVVTLWRGVVRCSDCPTPTPEQTSIGHPPKSRQLSSGTGKQSHQSQ